MHYLGNLLSQCVKGGRYESNHSTCAGDSGAASNKDMQAGSCTVKYIMSRCEPGTVHPVSSCF